MSHKNPVHFMVTLLSVVLYLSSSKHNREKFLNQFLLFLRKPCPIELILANQTYRFGGIFMYLYPNSRRKTILINYLTYLNLFSPMPSKRLSDESPKL